MEPDASNVEAFTVNDRVNRGTQIALGMDLNKQFALQLHASDLGSAGFYPTGRISYQTVGASALMYVGKNRHRWLRHGLNAYGRVGFGALRNDAEGDVPFEQVNSNHILYGAGVEYNSRSGLGLRLEGVFYEEDARYAQLALIYRLGRRDERRVEPIAESSPVLPAPVPALVVADPCAGLKGTLDVVNFHTNSYHLTVQAKTVLDRVAAKLSRCTELPVTISAHTDSVGQSSYNFSLSKMRAKSVALYLQGPGIDQERFTVESYGESRPIENNDTPEGRSRNRRVELDIQ
jgi:outer membrane protein OmpA-like peptidoglycan-associated protein